MLKKGGEKAKISGKLAKAGVEPPRKCNQASHTGEPRRVYSIVEGYLKYIVYFELFAFFTFLAFFVGGNGDRTGRGLRGAAGGGEGWWQVPPTTPMGSLLDCGVRRVRLPARQGDGGRDGEGMSAGWGGG